MQLAQINGMNALLESYECFWNGVRRTQNARDVEWCHRMLVM